MNKVTISDMQVKSTFIMRLKSDIAYASMSTVCFIVLSRVDYIESASSNLEIHPLRLRK